MVQRVRGVARKGGGILDKLYVIIFLDYFEQHTITWLYRLFANRKSSYRVA